MPTIRQEHAADRAYRALIDTASCLTWRRDWDTSAQHGPLPDIEPGRADPRLLRDLAERFPWATRDLAIAEAYADGVAAARAQATWTVDGNTETEHIRRVLAMLDAGDPQADDYLPRTPNLSGEFADDPTPQSVAADVLGGALAPWEDHGNNAPDMIDAETLDAIAEAWERGVSETFQEACETELRRWIPEPAVCGGTGAHDGQGIDSCDECDPVGWDAVLRRRT